MVFPAWIAPFCSVLGWFVLLLFCSVVFDVFAAILLELQEVAVARVVSQEDAQHLCHLLAAHARGRHTLNGIMFSWHKPFRLDMEANNLVSERTLLVACVRDVMQCKKYWVSFQAGQRHPNSGSCSTVSRATRGETWTRKGPGERQVVCPPWLTNVRGVRSFSC